MAHEGTDERRNAQPTVTSASSSDQGEIPVWPFSIGNGTSEKKGEGKVRPKAEGKRHNV